MTRLATSSYVHTSRYDFATDGGAQGTIALRGPKLPNKAIITDALIQVDQSPTGVGASIAVTTGETANDVQAVAAISGAPWSTTGAKRGSALTASGAPKTLTADRQPAIVVSGADLTAGKVRLILTVLEVV
jgi:hypothetical protein